MARAKGGRRETYEEAATRLWDNIILREVQDSQFAQYDSKQSMLDDFRSILWGNKAKAKGRSPPPFNSGFNVLIDHIESKAFDEKKNLLKFEDVYPDARRFRLAEDKYEQQYAKTLKERLKRTGEARKKKVEKALGVAHERGREKRGKQFKEFKIISKKVEVRLGGKFKGLRRTRIGERARRFEKVSDHYVLKGRDTKYGVRFVRGGPVFTVPGVTSRHLKTGVQARRGTPRMMLKNTRTTERAQITKQLRMRPNRPTVLKRRMKLTATSQLMNELKRMENKKSRRKPLSVYKR